MKATPFYWVELSFQPITKSPAVRYKPLRVKGFFKCEKKYLESAIEKMAKTSVNEIMNNTNNEVREVKWKIVKQERKQIDFIIDPCTISIPIDLTGKDHE